jgi:cytochrome P450
MDRIEEFATPIKRALEAHPVYAFVTLSLGFSVYRWNANRVKVPTYGSEIPVLSFISAIRFLTHTREILADGYKKYPIFKFPTTDRWIVVVSGKYTEELHRAPDDVLSFHEATRASLKTEYTLGEPIARNPWHTETIRGPLVRNLPNILGGMQEELELAFEDELALEGHEWKEIKFPAVIRRVVSRVSNRVFVGQPLCRNPEWRDLNVDYAIAVMPAAMFMSLLPNFIQPLIGKCLTHVKNAQRKAERLLVPTIEERYRLPPEERPNDFLTWLMEDAVEEERNPSSLTLRILAVNFAAIHTTSRTLVVALYQMLAHPECIQPLREEVESVVKEQGWTKAALFNMRKLDSFLRETQRIGGFSTIVMERKALKDFTFSDGTFIPKGSHVAAVSGPVNIDEEIYEDPLTFKPFRFAEAREGADDARAAIKNQMITTSPQYLLFGHGKHACPGRFFAVNEIKCLMGYILLNYDIKWSNREFLEGGYIPPNKPFGTFTRLDEDATIMLRRRIPT